MSTGAAAETPRSGRFRPRRFLLLVSILALVAAAGSLVDAAIEKNALAIARGSVRGDLRVTGVESHVLLTRLTLTGVSWVGPDGALLFASPRVSIDWSWLSFLRRGPLLDRLELISPRVNLVRAPGGGWNFVDAVPALSAPPGGPRPAPLVIDRLVIEGGALRVSDRTQDVDFSLEGLSAETAVRLPRLAARCTIEARGGFLAHAGVRHVLGPLRVAARLKGVAMTIDRADLSMGASKVRIGGRVGNAPALSGVDLHARGDLDATDLRTLLPSLEGLSGTIAIDGRMTGSVARPRIGGKLHGRRAKAWGLVMDDLQARFDFDYPAIRVPSIDIATLGGRINGDGALDLARRDYRLDLRCRGISGKRLVDLVLAGPLFEDARGRVDRRAREGIYEQLEGTIDLEGAGFAPERARGIANLSFQAPGQAPGSPGAFLLDAMVRVERGELRFERLRLDSADLRVRVGNPPAPPAPARRELPGRSAGNAQSG